jgi:hypothetical protein
MPEHFKNSQAQLECAVLTVHSRQYVTAGPYIEKKNIYKLPSLNNGNVHKYLLYMKALQSVALCSICGALLPIDSIS